jgi:predicted enzyme related to lactoylglutathione lyase
MPRPVHFEIQASDPPRLAKFYSEVFGWKVQHMPEMQYWLLMTGDEKEPGINGGILNRKGPKPAVNQSVNAYVCSIDVPSVDDYWKRALAAGASPALPKMTIPGVGYVAYVKDPDENILGLYQTDKSAQ